MVHGTCGTEAKMFLAELAKGRKPDVTVEAPLIVYDGLGNYTKEVAGILG
jgi:tRNA1(Val) A37 N6-methylase TrmN6